MRVGGGLDHDGSNRDENSSHSGCIWRENQ